VLVLKVVVILTRAAYVAAAVGSVGLLPLAFLRRTAKARRLRCSRFRRFRNDRIAASPSAFE